MVKQFVEPVDELYRARATDPSVLAQLLIAGGDSRIHLGPTGNLNAYGCRPLPRPDVLSFASSTASSISERAYAAVEKSVKSLQLANDFGDFESFVEKLRSKLKTVWGLGEETDVIFAPSGTDAELRALFLAKCVLPPPVVSIVVGSDETGSGMSYAAAGRHFDSETANKFQVVRGERIHGLAHDVNVRLIPTRAAASCARPPQEVDTAVFKSVEDAIAGGNSVILHVMAHSKLGASSPTPECVHRIREAWGGSVQIIDDACQARVSRAQIRSYLAQDRIVLITGSKFFTGPAFSGAVLVPAALSVRAAANGDVPMGFLKYTCASDWPPRFKRLRVILPPTVNIGQALRWAAAIDEMESYFKVPDHFRRAALREFSTFVTNCFDGRPNLRPLDQPCFSNNTDEEFSVPTVFPFLMLRNGQPCSLAEAKVLYRAMNEDLSAIMRASGPSQRRLLSQCCHFGQPVEIPQRAKENVGALRVSADARLVSDSWSGGDEESANARLRSNIARLKIVFDKLQFLLDHLDDLRGSELPHQRNTLGF
ncbi:MAG: hypothetical protein P8Y71_13425 [Pseudolabrys sp.]|jgi:hypothetical protein